MSFITRQFNKSFIVYLITTIQPPISWSQIAGTQVELFGGDSYITGYEVPTGVIDSKAFRVTSVKNPEIFEVIQVIASNTPTSQDNPERIASALESIQELDTSIIDPPRLDAPQPWVGTPEDIYNRAYPQLTNKTNNLVNLNHGPILLKDIANGFQLTNQQLLDWKLIQSDYEQSDLPKQQSLTNRIIFWGSNPSIFVNSSIKSDEYTTIQLHQANPDYSSTHLSNLPYSLYTIFNALYSDTDKGRITDVQLQVDVGNGFNTIQRYEYKEYSYFNQPTFIPIPDCRERPINYRILLGGTNAIALNFTIDLTQGIKKATQVVDKLQGFAGITNIKATVV